MKDSLQDFILYWQHWDKDCRHSSSSSIIDGGTQWDHRFRDAGYYYSKPGNPKKDWGDIHEWCRKMYGEQHYAWTCLDTFWFECEQDAVLFSLRWA